MGRSKSVRSTFVRATWIAGAATLLAVSAPILALNPNHQITQYVHRIWQAQPGLLQTSIYALSQTRDGYLWLGTQSGVVRFDGMRFSPVEALRQASLGDIWARAIEEDTAGRVWITSNDLSLIRVARNGDRHDSAPGNDLAAGVYSAKVFTEKDGLPTKDYSCLVPGPKGEMWACAATGLVRFEGDEFAYYPFPEPVKTRPITACRASDGTIWAGGGSEVQSFNGTAFSRVALRQVSGDLVIRSLLCAGRDVWVGTAKGLIRIEDGRQELYTTREGLADNVILSLGQGRNGDIWVGTRNGFSRLRNGAIESYGYREGLSQNAVFAIREDREGSLWVATKNGLNQFFDGAATRYAKSEGMPSENMGPLLEDRRGILWAGTLDAGLARFNGRRFTPVPSLASGRITTLAESADGALWAGTDQGLKRLEDGQVQASYGVEQGLPSARILSLFRDRAGSLWAGTRRGPAVLRNGRFAVPEAFGGELAAPIAAMGETRDGTMLFAVEQGNVYLYKGGQLSRLDPSPGPLPPGLTASFQDVNAIYTDPDGVVWMGTNGGGLAIWRNGKLSRFLVRDGLFDSEIYGFVAATPDQLWMACSNGFFSVSRADVFKYADGKARKIVSAPYSPLDGLRTVQGTPGVQPVGTRTKDGRLWFSSSVWLLALAPDLGVGDVAPPVEVEAVTVNGTSMPPNQALTLNPGRNSVAFEYTALTFRAPQRTSFRYILEGYDKNWTDAGGRREAFYTNLPPGKFRFRVQACGGLVPCSETAAPVLLEVPPRLYQRIWFYPSLAAALGLLVWTIYRVRVRRLRDQFVLVLAERSRIARELHDTLIQGFSGITMQLQAFTSRLRTTEERQALGEIIRDAGICLQETRRSVAGLRAGTASSSGLAAAIADSARQLTEERGLRLKLNLDDVRQELPAEVKYNLLCIVQEAITNCIKHADARTVEVSMAYAGGELRLVVIDDGRGIARGQGNGTEGHYGMVGMRERASQIGAEFEVSSNPGFGTTVSVRMPVTRDVPALPHARLEALR
jgi:signal transduction histidine kinase/ligand-binding sensor domain-containing protein